MCDLVVSLVNQHEGWKSMVLSHEMAVQSSKASNGVPSTSPPSIPGPQPW